MELQNGIKYFNRMEAAFKLINELQIGSQDMNYLLTSLSHKDLLLPDGNTGSLIEFAILMQKYVATLYLIENDSIDVTEEEVKNALEKSIAVYNGYESEERLSAVAVSDKNYGRIYDSYVSNNIALNSLRERYLNVKRVRE